MVNAHKTVYFALALLIALAGMTVFSPTIMGDTVQASELSASQIIAPTIQETDSDADTESDEMEVEEMDDAEDMDEAGEMDDAEDMDDAAEMDSETMDEEVNVLPDVLIQLEDREITRGEFDEAFVRAMQMYAVQRDIPLHQRTYDFYTDLRDQYLEQFTLEQVLLQQADEMGLLVNPAAAEYLILDFRRSFPDEESYQEALQSMGFADEDALITFVQQSTAIDNVLTEMSSDISVSEEELTDFYHDNLQAFRVEPGVYLPLEQVEEQVRNLLVRQQLQERLIELRDQQAIEIFSGNLTPIEELTLNDLGMIESMPDIEDASEADDEVATMEDVVSIIAGDQVVAKNTVVIDRVFSEGPAWVVIHANDDGSPGAILGFEAIPGGAVENLAVVLDSEPEGNVLWAMLHEDADEELSFDFPDGDPPIMRDGNVVIDVFNVLAPPVEEVSITVEDQVVAENTVVIDRMFTVGPAWVVIHADDDGAPGEILGFEAIPGGVIENLAVVMDSEPEGNVLWAMLHEDADEELSFDFPDGDPPVMRDGNVVMEAFSVLPPSAEETSETD